MFQPTRPVKGATWYGLQPRSFAQVSTHAPREGRDEPTYGKISMTPKFQPTRPVKGATCQPPPEAHNSEAFQPTRPVKGATPVCR